MVRRINHVVKALIALFILFNCNKANGQDSLSIEQLQPLTYAFNIENGIFKGEGATFLSKEISNAQFTMIGEYHGSKRISEFTEALIPILDSLGYKTIVTEVGPISGQVLNNLNANTLTELRRIIEKYMIVEEDGYVNPPFPFFENVEDANFLKEAKSRKWSIIGIDQEYYYCHQMLIDIMYDNLNTEEQITINDLYQQVSDSIALYNKLDVEGGLSLTISVNKSVILQDFISKASTSKENVEVAEALLASNYIYRLNSDKQWFENNATRIRYMKAQLKKQLEQLEFDLSKDKLLIKMGAYHLSRGFSPLGLFEVGNTLTEIAEYHGNNTLNIAFSSRFYVEEDKVIDVLESNNQYQQQLRDLDKMGRKEEWVVIDLRPMVKGHYYIPVKYKFNEHIEDLVKRYDLLIIPKIEINPTPNYKEE